MLLLPLVSALTTVLSTPGEAIGSQYSTAVAPPGSIPPLYRFLQQHFDSTIVYQQQGSWNQGPNMLILSKKGQQVYFFTYRSPYQPTQGHYIPGGLTQKFSKQEARFRAIQPDTNQYFLPQRVSEPVLKQTWKNLHPTQLWQVRNNDARSSDEECIIEDASTVTLWFLTRANSRTACFYAPDFYEECAGPGVNRRQAIKTRMALEALLR
ncbi:hypothetical protein [Hymenobacter psychrophilus]|uniref:Uncharacterized protein n=1 Tax=Hymenobacter psychrophilus TaxID=651662 RepID=A0A1H3I0Z1_9BACT|nr:hypothetical protein [Hymenobacter psychrophilus]SDY21282.1 hypothetical protein SAMN04488069_106234 [Hymenobacter psychrophilus]